MKHIFYAVSKGFSGKKFQAVIIGYTYITPITPASV
jgi:hypothetical protein